MSCPILSCYNRRSYADTSVSEIFLVEDLLFLRLDVVFTSDPQLLYLRLQRCPFQAQSVSGALGPANHSTGFSQHSNDVLPLGVLQCVVRGVASIGLN